MGLVEAPSHLECADIRLRRVFGVTSVCAFKAAMCRQHFKLYSAGLTCFDRILA
jgi:hypothetical protein